MRNHLKTVKTTQKLPETSHVIVFLLKISYSQVVLVVILKCYFEKIWSQNLKLSKLTEIWYLGT